jgi:hypothetical protein
MELFQKCPNSSDVRGGHGRSAQKVEVKTTLAWRRNCGENIYARGYYVWFQQVTGAREKRAAR